MVHAVPRGEELLQRLATPEIQAILREAAHANVPGVAAITAIVIDVLGADNAARRVARQFVGTAVRAAMQSMGYDVRHRNAIRGNPLFSSGAVYGQVAPVGTSRDIIFRFLQTLTDSEREHARAVLNELRRRK
jgi:hypothetical protein